MNHRSSMSERVGKVFLNGHGYWWNDSPLRLIVPFVDISPPVVRGGIQYVYLLARSWSIETAKPGPSFG